MSHRGDYFEISDPSGIVIWDGWADSRADAYVQFLKKYPYYAANQIANNQPFTDTRRILTSAQKCRAADRSIRACSPPRTNLYGVPYCGMCGIAIPDSEA